MSKKEVIYFFYHDCLRKAFQLSMNTFSEKFSLLETLKTLYEFIENGQQNSIHNSDNYFELIITTIDRNFINTFLSHSNLPALTILLINVVVLPKFESNAPFFGR